jgi:hypothetical protein
MTFRLTTVSLIVTAALIQAQAPDVKLPPSPRGTAAIQVGGTWSGTGNDRRYTGGSWITVDYGRPILRGRENIFGTGGDYGKTVNPDAPIWRAGANETTRLTTQVPLEIGGKTIPAGEYNMFVDLKVLLYGAYNYDSKFDIVRAPMRLSTSATSIEQFTIGFADVKPDRGVLYMAWERTIGSIDFTVRN